MFQKEIIEYCKQFYPNLKIQDRFFIFPFQIDILIPQIKLAIEFNGLKYHGQLVGINKFYHQQKYELCKAKGYELFIIWDFQWKKYKEQIKSHLLQYFIKHEKLNYYLIKNNKLLIQNEIICQLQINNNIITNYYINNLYSLQECLNILLKNEHNIFKYIKLGKQSQNIWLNAGFNIKKFIQPKNKFKYNIKYYDAGRLFLQKK